MTLYFCCHGNTLRDDNELICCTGGQQTIGINIIILIDCNQLSCDHDLTFMQWSGFETTCNNSFNANLIRPDLFGKLEVQSMDTQKDFFNFLKSLTKQPDGIDKKSDNMFFAI